MLDFVINIFGDIADFLMDLWVDKIVRRKRNI